MAQGFFEIDSWGELVGTTASSPRHCTLAGIVKVSTPQQRFVVPNEYICGRLGLMLGLPVAPGVVVMTEDKDEIAYVCLRFGERGERPPPAIPEDLVGELPMMSAGVMAFDCWILNNDRHDENLAYTNGVLQLFDHGHALFGPDDKTYGATYLQSHQDSAVYSMCLAPTIATSRYFERWATRIKSVHDDVIRDIVADVTQVGGRHGLTSDEGAVASEFLISRKGRILDLLASEPENMPNITDWEPS